MARIRTVKPEFFRHEKLQELGPLSMLIFEGLWTQCDKEGRFQWRPRTLKLDILPFINFEMEKELHKLAEHFFIVKYESEGEQFGVIPSFLDHQRISGKELQEPAKYPSPPPLKARKTKGLRGKKQGSTGEAPGKQSGSDGDHPEFQEGKGKEEEGKGNGMDFSAVPAGERTEKQLRDGLWDGIREVTGFEPKTDGDRKRMGKVVSELRARGALPEEVPIRAGRYRQAWPKITLTPEAMAKHWDQFGRDITTGVNGAVTDLSTLQRNMDAALAQLED